MARIQKKSPLQNLFKYQTFITDSDVASKYFKLSEVQDQLTAGKNAFLIEGTPFLKPSTELKIEVLDVEGNPLFVEIGRGVPEYYEGLSKLISIHVYESTPIGIGKITILSELQTYIDENGNEVPVPGVWEGIYNVKWEREVKINKNLGNETRVRFLKKPSIIIYETGESFYSKNIINANQTNDSVRGIAITPEEGINFLSWAGGIKYLIQKESGSFVDDGKYITVYGTNIQNAEIVEYLNQKTVIVQTPATSSANLISNFTGKNYALNYEYVSSIIESSVFGSFARFEINNLATFVGDAERLKVYAKSRSTSADYYLLHDTKINSSNLLTEIVSSSIENLGYFKPYYSNGKPYTYYWVTQSSANISLDSNEIYKAIKFQNNKVSSNLGNNIRLEKGSEYSLTFYTHYSGSISNPSDTLDIYMSSTLRTPPGIASFILTQSLASLKGSNLYKTPQKLSYNFIPDSTDDWTINFEANNPNNDTYWYVGSVVLEASNELGFSPDEFTFTIPISRQLERETFDFRFEYYDINNNYVPVTNTETQIFVSGNLALLGKNLVIDADKNIFNFNQDSKADPSSQLITIYGTKTRISSSLLITSQAFDSGGVYIPTASYIGSEYPGRLTNLTEDLYAFNATLDIAQFTGSLHGSPPGPGNVIVDRILYTFSDDNLIEPSVRRLAINRSLINVNYVLSSSHADTASYAPNYLPLTGGTINGNVTLNGTASIAFLNVTYESSSIIYSTGSNIFGDNEEDTQTLNGIVLIPTGALYVSGSTVITGSLVVTDGITGSLYGTASYALNGGGTISTTGSTLYSTAPSGHSNFTTTGSIFLGSGSGDGATDAFNSNFFGENAGYGATYSYKSNFLGLNAGANATNAYESNFIGEEAGKDSVTSNWSNFIGYLSGRSSNTSAASNFIGVSAGEGSTNTLYSNFLGPDAGYGATNVRYSNFIGYGVGVNSSNVSHSFLAGYNVGNSSGGNIGHNNIIIGTNITLQDSIANAINLGSIIFATGSYGDTTTTPYAGTVDGKVGINVINPVYNLDVSGSGNYNGGLVVTGSVTIDTILTLVSQSVLPTSGVPSGSFMTSGSGTDLKPYFWNGDSWTPLF